MTFCPRWSRSLWKRSPRWPRWKKAPSPILTRTAWLATTGCARRNWRQHRRIAEAITSTLAAIKAFAAKVHKGEIAGPAGKFRELLVIGIGGSALGPQLVSQALGRLKAGRDRMRVHFFDNTDPDGMDQVLREIAASYAGPSFW